MDEFDQSEIYNKNIRYFRVRVLIKWNQTFHWKGDEESFKASLKDIIMNKKLTSIPDRSKISQKLDGIFAKYIQYEGLEVDEELLKSDELDSIRVQVSYNILDKNIGELLTSSIKALFMSNE